MSIVRTTDDLVRRFRSDVDDPLRGPPTAPDNDSLWSIQDVSDYMTEAASVVGRRTQQLFGTFTLPVTAGQALVPLPVGTSTVGDVRRAYLQTARREVRDTNFDDLRIVTHDYGLPLGTASWETITGQPRWYLRDYVPGQLRLVPIPEDSDTLELTAMFIPLMDDGYPLPFQDPEDIALMLLWMKKMAYSKHDADTFDEKRSAAYEVEFQRRMLERKSEAFRLRQAPTPVRFSW